MNLFFATVKPVKLLTVNEAAEIKGISRQAIWAAINTGRLSTIMVDMPNVRITERALAAFQPNPNMQRSGRKANGTKRKK